MLVLPAADVAAELAAQEALAARAPDTEDEVRRRRLYLEHGLAEVQRNDFPEQASQRAAALAQLRVAIAAEGDDAVAAARARDVGRVMPALRGEEEQTDEERAGELGAFPAMLERYGAVIAGHRVAPELVIRAMFHARWNAIHGLALTEGMSAIARRAYYGWLAVEGGNAPLGMRLEALDAYEAAGGARVLETRAWLEHEAGERAAAGADYERACDRTGSVRLCNHALAEMLAASEP
ncbi:MAG: hypothetical protein U0234_26690 [Sandaracinus sp.]